MRKQGEKLFYVYVMASRSRTLYVGFTSDLYVRVQQHRKGTYEGFSSENNCRRLVSSETYTDPITAMAGEKQIKRWRGEKKLFLIEQSNPTWIDLSADWGTLSNPYSGSEFEEEMKLDR